MKNRHIVDFDPKGINFKKVEVESQIVVRRLLYLLLIAFGVTVMGYLVFAFFYSTEEEKRLSMENRMYEKVLPTLGPRELLLEDAIANLQHKDSRIYEQVFHSSAPNVDPMSQLGFLFSSDTIPDTRLVSYTRDKSDELLARAGRVDEAFRKIFRTLSDTNTVIPPMSLPLKDISYTQTGASSGKKMSPFLKAYVYHNGLDIIVLRGSEVFAPADGTVLEVGNDKSNGRYLVISHSGGYTTSFSHLESVEVKKGNAVRRGDLVGTVGLTGTTLAPHLHYEVRRDGVTRDPVNHFFASISPSEYANMLYMATNTVQSMD